MHGGGLLLWLLWPGWKVGGGQIFICCGAKILCCILSCAAATQCDGGERRIKPSVAIQVEKFKPT